ncbi:hypothetical protein EYF80_001189 [Liparis tanakae]|uniref:Uncharacterized protein n=1 Tax=Liparis tanakae TaxID=230148 RepID=A0A4Z2JEL8_9TELE|nr:hypothetical protein EYF80_001189 [Liparis tanakae]
MQKKTVPLTPPQPPTGYVEGTLSKPSAVHISAEDKSCHSTSVKDRLPSLCRHKRRFGPKYLLGLAVTVCLPSRARREVGEEERLHRMERESTQERVADDSKIN